MELQYHPLSQKFPPLPPEELRALARDIRENGLQHPIVILDGMILDGVHRYQACLVEGVIPQFRDFEGGDPEAFVNSVNLFRRHLTAAEKRERIKARIKAQPDLSSREIARQAKTTHATVERVRREVESETPEAPASNGEAIHYEPPAPPDPISEVAPAPAPQRRERRTAAGRRAPGRKAGTTATPADKPKKANGREAWIEAVSARYRSDAFGAACDMVQINSGYDAMILANSSAMQREELVIKFATSLDVKIEIHADF